MAVPAHQSHKPSGRRRASSFFPFCVEKGGRWGSNGLFWLLFRPKSRYRRPVWAPRPSKINSAPFFQPDMSPLYFREIEPQVATSISEP